MTKNIINLQKIFTPIIILNLVVFSTLKTFSQNHKEEGDLLKFVEGPGIKYSYLADSSQKEFYQQNQSRILQIQDSLEGYPIDRCHNGYITLHIWVDSSGSLLNVQLLKGLSTPKLDNLITSLVQNLPGKWMPAKDENIPKLFNGNISYLLVNSNETSRTTRHSDQNSWGMEMKKEVDVNKNCSNNEYFYDKGVKEFNDNNFKAAIYNFKNAHEANPYDLDVIFNTGISYIKLDDTKNACKFFKKGAAYGDTESEKKYNSLCSEAQE